MHPRARQATVKRLEEVESVGRELATEAFVVGKVLASALVPASTGAETTEAQEKKDKDKSRTDVKTVPALEDQDIPSLFLFLAKLFAGKRFLDRLAKIMSLPHPAQARGEDTVSFYTKTGEQVSVKYTGYDLVELVLLYETLNDKEARKRLVDTTINALRTTIVEDGDKRVTLEEYLGEKWNEFAEKTRKELEATIDWYLQEIVTTKGSPLAKHIYLREAVLRSQNPSWAWLFAFSESFTLYLATLYTDISASYVTRVFKPRAAKYIRYIARFRTAVSGLAPEEAEVVAKITGKVPDPEKARQEFEKLSRQVQAIRARLAPEVLRHMLDIQIPVKVEHGEEKEQVNTS